MSLVWGVVQSVDSIRPLPDFYLQVYQFRNFDSIMQRQNQTITATVAISD